MADSSNVATKEMAGQSITSEQISQVKNEIIELIRNLDNNYGTITENTRQIKDKMKDIINEIKRIANLFNRLKEILVELRKKLKEQETGTSPPTRTNNLEIYKLKSEYLNILAEIKKNLEAVIRKKPKLINPEDFQKIINVLQKLKLSDVGEPLFPTEAEIQSLNDYLTVIHPTGAPQAPPEATPSGLGPEPGQGRERLPPKPRDVRQGADIGGKKHKKSKRKHKKRKSKRRLKHNKFKTKRRIKHRKTKSKKSRHSKN
jgi:hypothetical protein